MSDSKAIRLMAKEEIKEIKERLKRIKGLSREEQRKEKEKIKNERKEKKAELNNLTGEEKKTGKRIYKKVERGLHPVRAVASRILALALCLCVIAVSVAYLMVGALMTRAISAGLPVDTPEAKKVQSVSKEDVVKVAEEGVVLLKNENNVLPLTQKNVNLFGVGSVKSVFGGGGSGSADTSTAVTLQKGLENSGFSCNPTLNNLYSNWVNLGIASTEDAKDVDTSQVAGLEQTVNANFTVNELPAKNLTSDIMDSAKEFSDTAIVVFSRTGSEGNDLNYKYLQLSEEERGLLDSVCKSFEHVVVLVNAVNPMELGFIDEYPQIKGALCIGAVGNTGMNAVGEILSGKVNPSGRTVDTYAYDLMSNPANIMIGSEKWSEGYAYNNLEGTYFINYYEGIYIGYRYYETAAADGYIDYEKTVQYPFGYGLSYTDFQWNITDYQTSEDSISVKVNVTNVGDVAGKDVVELYYQAPYTKGGIEKSATELAAFAKTDLLEPGQSQDLILTYAVRDMASFDSKNTKGYILEAGDYNICLCSDSHTVKDSRVYTVDSDRIFDTDEVTGETVMPQFEDASGDITYLSRSDWDGTWPNLDGISFEASEDTLKSLDYEVRNDKDAKKIVTGEKNNIMLSELKGLSYDDSKWEEFLNQLTLKEMCKLVVSGGYGTEGVERLGVPAKKDMDGPAAINNVWAGTSGVQFPAGIVIASTWNLDMAELVASDIASEANIYGVVGWYAPGANLHRSAFGGRNFEYYSEDPLLSGKMAASEIKAAEDKGLVVYLKHFALNEQENHRNDNGIYTWSNEQAIREMYLKSFEVAVKEGQPLGVMSSFNRIGNVWTGGNSALLQTVLRDEWGFCGVVVTDATQSVAWPYMNQAQGIMNGNDLFLNYSSVLDAIRMKRLARKNAVLQQKLRTACHNILYTVANSAAVE